MAENVNIGGSGKLFVGEDKTFRLFVPTIDISLWEILFDVRVKDTSADPALLSKVPVVQGIYNADPLLNTQCAVAVVSDDEMNVFKAKSYRYSFKRMDAGLETVLAYGDFSPEKATAP